MGKLKFGGIAVLSTTSSFEQGQSSFHTDPFKTGLLFCVSEGLSAGTGDIVFWSSFRIVLIFVFSFFCFTLFEIRYSQKKLPRIGTNRYRETHGGSTQPCNFESLVLRMFSDIRRHRTPNLILQTICTSTALLPTSGSSSSLGDGTAFSREAKDSTTRGASRNFNK